MAYLNGTFALKISNPRGLTLSFLSPMCDNPLTNSSHRPLLLDFNAAPSHLFSSAPPSLPLQTLWLRPSSPLVFLKVINFFLPLYSTSYVNDCSCECWDELVYFDYVIVGGEYNEFMYGKNWQVISNSHNMGVKAWL